MRLFAVLLTTFAFLASLVVLPFAGAAPAKSGTAAIDAARLAIVHMAKPEPRKVERTRSPGPAMTLRVLAVAPTRLVRLLSPAHPVLWRPPAPARSLSMVFLN